jgi:hypothetical protein
LPLAPRYHWYDIGEVVASDAVTLSVVDVPLKIDTLCGCVVIAGVAQTCTVAVALLAEPHVPVTFTQYVAVFCGATLSPGLLPPIGDAVLPELPAYH